MSEEIITHSSLVGKLLVGPKVDIPAYTDRTDSYVSDTYVSERQRIANGLARSRSAAYRSVKIKRSLYKLSDRAVLARNSLRRAIPRPIMLAIAFIACIFAAIKEFSEANYRRMNRHIGAFRYAISRRIVNFCAPRAAGMLFLAVSVFAVVSSSIVGVGLQVYIDGEPVGFVSKRSDFINVVERVEDKVSQILGYPYTLNTDVSYNIEMFNRKEILDLETAEKILFSGISEIEQAYVITVDGEIIGAHRDKEAIETIINSFLQKETAEAEGETITRVEFVRDIDVNLQYTNAKYVKTLSEINQVLSSNVRDRESYKIQAGDTLEAIARNHGLSTQALIALNPDIDPDNIMEGQVITVKEEIPLMSIRTVKKLVTEEEIPYTTEYVDDKTLFVGVQKTKVQGQNGKKLVTTEIVSVDGQEESSTVISEEVVEEPVTEVIRVGIKKRAPTGTYIVPYNGTISSRFGWRIFQGKYDYHTGIDFAGPKGSLVVASDGGTVVKAGWYGAYGYCVIISHGNGIQTLYGHNSKLLVKVGDKVAQGEAIARVGSTGRSTGPHVHFEIRINGTAVNPAKYLWK